MLLFYTNIAGQTAKPAQFIMKKIHDNTRCHQYNACYYKIFTCLHKRIPSL